MVHNFTQFPTFLHNFILAIMIIIKCIVISLYIKCKDFQHSIISLFLNFYKHLQWSDIDVSCIAIHVNKIVSCVCL